jgi:hypothetical protein
MSRKLQRRGFAAVVLVSALILAAPAHAAGLPDWGDASTLLHRAWLWLGSLVPGTGSARQEAPAVTHGLRAFHEPSGAVVDPTGGTPSACTTLVCPTDDGDRGMGSDPNG